MKKSKNKNRNKNKNIIRIATYNLRVTKLEDILRGRAFLFRLPRILRNLKKADADVIAFQEVQRLHITCLRLFLRGYKIHWAKWLVNGGTAIATKKNHKVKMEFSNCLLSGRNSATQIIEFNEKTIVLSSLHLSLNNDKIEDIREIEFETRSKNTILVGDFNILADDDNHEVFRYLKKEGYQKLNHDKGGFHGYGDADKTPTTVDNFFTNFGELEDLHVIDEKKSSDHYFTYIDLIL